MAFIYNGKGQPIGEVRDLGKGDSNTYDNKGQPLGHTRANGTYDKNDHKISPTADSGLTFGNRKK